MKMIYKIAKKELQLLFYSPIAWLLLTLFIVQTAIVFTGKYEGFMKNNIWESGVQMMVSINIFMRGLWGVVLGYLYFYIPLLTMSLVSKELSSGSIKLLYSSPVKNSQIILGKFFSMVMYAGIMTGILLIYVVFAWYTVKDFELAAVLTGLLGIFLVACTYAAVGIFVSSLTSYQFVAALGTFITLLLLSYVGGLWQEYDVIRDVTYWLSISGRASTFVQGMICSEDLLYFPLVITLFLALTIIRLKAVREKKRFTVSLGRYASVILIACTLGYFSSRPKLMAYYDATSNKFNTLSPQSQEIVSKLDGGLTITGYSNILNPGYSNFAFPRFIQRNRNLFQKYERFKPEMKLKMVYYYDTITSQDHLSLRDGKRKDTLSILERVKKVCKQTHTNSAILKSPEEVRKMTDLTGEKTFVWQIVRENGQKAWLRVYTDDLSPYPSESEISAALKRMVMKLPKVGFVSGYGIRAINDFTPQGYSFLAGNKHSRYSLLNQGFDAQEVVLEQGVPDDIDILTIGEIRESLSPVEEEQLKKYIDRGGNLFILGEPRRRDIMNPLLSKYFGVELLPGTLVQYRYPQFQPDVLFSCYTPEAENLSFYFRYYIVMPGTAGIEQVADRGYRFFPLLQSDTTLMESSKKPAGSYIVWNELESLNFDEEKPRFNPDAGEVVKEYCTAAVLTRKVGDKEQRVIIAGDADCISNGELRQTRAGNNFSFIFGAYNYLSHNEMPVDVRKMQTTDDRVYIGKTGYNIMNIGFKILFPLLLAGTGTVLLIRRKGR